ncbi:glycoside hydrolase family protein [Halosimplex halophilum]|uniref:hypothetical protein n=1 Tax=Halosimplex halophilum TaxID=2559572 RepID=UPI00107F6844|nr:hypothetical protein [Halosimplex halophilum]
MGILRNFLRQWREKRDGTLEGPALSTEVLNNTYHAENFSGANGGEMIQNAVDAAASTVGFNKVVVNGPGPDDVSDSTGSMSDPTWAENAWELTQHLSIPSYTYVVFENCYIFLADGTDDNLVRNADFQNGDQYIVIEYQNAVFDGNNLNQTEIARSTSDALVNLGFRFYNVDNLHMHGRGIVRNTNAWGGKIEGVTESSASGITWWQNGETDNMDGIKVLGPADNVTIRDFDGRTGDDMTSANDYDEHLMDGSGGPVRNVTFENIRRRSSQDGSGNAVRVWQYGNSIVEDITIGTVMHKDGLQGSAAVSLGFGLGASSFKDFSNITVENVVSNNERGVTIMQPVRNVTIDNIVTKNGENPVNVAAELHGSSISNVSGVDCAAILKVGGLLADTTVDLGGQTNDASLNAAIRVPSGGTVERCDVELGTFDLQKDGLQNGDVLKVESDGGWYDTNIRGGTIRRADSFLNLQPDSTGHVDNVEIVGTVSTIYAETGDLSFGPNMPAFDSAPAHINRSMAWASPSWDPDGDGNGELVVSDGSSWNEAVDLPNWA